MGNSQQRLDRLNDSRAVSEKVSTSCVILIIFGGTDKVAYSGQLRVDIDGSAAVLNKAGAAPLLTVDFDVHELAGVFLGQHVLEFDSE